MITTTQIEMALGHVNDPDLGRSLTELGMIENIKVDGKKVSFDLVLTTPACPMKKKMSDDCIAAIHELVDREAEVEINLTSRPQPDPKEEFKEVFEHIHNTIVVASGKGGVGKSTVAVNLAVALARQGYRVGLADADVYGPSVPTMTGTEDAVIEMEGEDEHDSLFVPVEKYGVKWLSVGHVSNAGQALIWRGPMASTALKQIILQTLWGPLDYLLIDMPPGTGDIHISLIGDVPLSGAVIVTTPQAVALSDVLRGVNMFRNPQVQKPIYGLVENMAWFTPAEHPQEKYYLFGRDGGSQMARSLDIPFLGQIPLVQSIREGADDGTPVALLDRPDSQAFLDLASRLVAAVEA